VDVATALGTYLDIVDLCAPGLVEGLYVVGSFALDDWQPESSDIDIVAVTAEPATEEDAGALLTAHALLAEQQPRPFVDGPYLAWGDLITPAMALHRPWTLNGELHHDGDCFELNPVTWYVLATRGVTVRGPTVDRLGVYVDIDAQTQFVIDNLRGYWQPLADQVRAACTVAPDRTFEPSMLEWCALGALRLHVTAFTGEVVSKTAAGEYGLRVAPAETHGALSAAIAIRHGDRTRAVTAPDMLCAADLIEWCAADVARAARPS
jgi:Nucleotidyltransferase domain